MAHLGKVKLDPLFLGLTRPAMLFGVSYMYFGFNVLICLMYFVMTSDFKIVLVAVAIHVFGMVITKKEPLAVEILMTRLTKCGGCRNRQFYGGVNSYSVW